MALRFKALWLAIGYAFVLLVAFLSLTPSPPDLGVRNGLKIGHVLAYAWLMLWFAQIYPLTAARLRIAAMLCAMGIALECLQGLTAYRTFSYIDMGLDSFGVTLGLLMAYTRLQHVLAIFDDMLSRRASLRW